MNPNLETEWNALQHGCAVGAVPDRALLHVTGADSTRWLNSMVTNSVTALGPGQGAYSFVLNAQGRIQGDCTVYRESSPADPASFLLSTTAVQAASLQPWLERYIIMDEVELAAASRQDASLVVLGPGAPLALRALTSPPPEALAPLTLRHADTPEGPLLLLTPPPGRVPKVELRGTASLLAAVRHSLVEAGAVELSSGTLEASRVFEGKPLFGTDIRDRDLPQETGQEHALHFAKGCYLGQEIVERIRSRGQVHRLFTRFQLSGELPASLPAKLEADGKPAGELTSAAEVPSANGPLRIAVGYTRRELLNARTLLAYPGGTAMPAPPLP